MKKVLGLDLGVASIGWAYVNEAEKEGERSSIVKLGVRVNPLTTDEQTNFDKGKPITTTADRTLKRSMRRNLQRYKLRRDELKKILVEQHFITEETILSERGNKSTFETYRLRAKSADEKVSLEELARILLMINKKRGYKSSRKSKSSEEGSLIDGMDVAKKLYENDWTPAQFVLDQFNSGKKYIPDFYRSDLQGELDKILLVQKDFYPELITPLFSNEICGRDSKATWAICAKAFNVVGAKRTTKGFELKKENYQWRVDALNGKVSLEQLTYILQDINGQISSSSGYLGKIGDRSKELFFKKQTVGQYLMAQLAANPNASLTNQVFYRQDYLDEFDRIWTTQAKFHPELTDELKHDVRDVVIFYQRRLKSQKGLISFCEFEKHQIEIEEAGKKKIKWVGPKVAPKSSPVFQDFKVLQILNNLEIVNLNTGEVEQLDADGRALLYNELSIRDKLSKSDVLKLLYGKTRGYELNYKELEGNRTMAALYGAFNQIVDISGHEPVDFAVGKKSVDEIKTQFKDIFELLGIDVGVLETESSYQLWHLLYSFEGDNTPTGDGKLLEKLEKKFGFTKEYGKILAQITFQPDYGSLSTKAIRKLLPFMQEGFRYDEACDKVGYNHSHSMTKEELDAREQKEHLEVLPKNSLRNPVVEKILNQMVHVVNGVIDAYGKPDEIRIELARELKKSAKERDEATKSIAETTKNHERIRKILKDEFHLDYISRSDIVRYKLYEELEATGFHTLYSNTYIPKEKLFDKSFDIEHIIPQSRLFDDSFGNKTLETRECNIEKGNDTALDYVQKKYGEEGTEQYRQRIGDLLKDGKISKTKYNNLLRPGNEIPEGFINRDLRDSQYIAKAAKDLLQELVRDVVPTCGGITAQLREDWELVDVLQELNWDKYDKLGKTSVIENRDGRKLRRIDDWTKRNDHRHHAMDALTIAFTKRSIVQYLNNLNARSDKNGVIYAIEQKELHRDKNHHLRFNAPIPLKEFRAEAKQQLENILVSIKAKNKVATRNINVVRQKNGKLLKKMELTPRGQLHNETIYGKQLNPVSKMEKIGASFDASKIATVSNAKIRDLLSVRLNEFDGDAKKAFTGKNSLSKNPIWLDADHTKQLLDKVKTISYETQYTIRKEISPDLKIEKVVDGKVRKILEDRLAEYDGDAKKAFSNIDDSPIWLNKEKGIAIKRVTITGVANATALRNKRDKEGSLILDDKGNPIPVDYVNTGNNHHVAIYRDSDGNLQDVVVSFYEAVQRINRGKPIIDKELNKDDGWNFLFSMKQNEYFVFPNESTGFNPKEIDLMDEKNYPLISPNLFRVQKFSKTPNRVLVFRHHLETLISDDNDLRNITWKRLNTLDEMKKAVKVRVNHIGKIVAVGEE